MTMRGERANDIREFGRSAVNTLLDRVGRGVSKVQERTPLAYDLLESPDAYLVVFDAPGATDDDLQVRFRRGAVEVRIDRFREFHEGFDMRFPGRGLSLDGRARLPDDTAVDPDGATATLSEHGTLRVRVPKDDEARRVDVDDESALSDDGPEEIDLGDDGDEGAALSENPTDEDESTLSAGGDANAEADESALSDEGETDRSGDATDGNAE